MTARFHDLWVNEDIEKNKRDKTPSFSLDRRYSLDRMGVLINAGEVMTTVHALTKMLKLL